MPGTPLPNHPQLVCEAHPTRLQNETRSNRCAEHRPRDPVPRGDAMNMPLAQSGKPPPVRRRRTSGVPESGRAQDPAAPNTQQACLSRLPTPITLGRLLCPPNRRDGFEEQLLHIGCRGPFGEVQHFNAHCLSILVEVDNDTRRDLLGYLGRLLAQAEIEGVRFVVHFKLHRLDPLARGIRRRR